MFNKVILVGYITKDPDLRYTSSGMPVMTARIASNHKYKQGDQYIEDNLFINAVIFGKRAESVKKYLSKGSTILVEGRLKENKWEQDGVQKSRIEILASDIKFLSRKAEPDNKKTENGEETSEKEEPF